MSRNTGRFLSLLSANGSDATYHRESGGDPCPCLVDGFRDPQWHEDNPTAPVCNEQGRINVTVVSGVVKAFVQPIQSTRATRLSTEYIEAMFGTEIEADDQLGVFPITWGGINLDFRDWSQAGEDYVLYDGRRFIVVNANKMPDTDGDPNHHWEVALRLLKTERPA